MKPLNAGAQPYPLRNAALMPADASNRGCYSDAALPQETIMSATLEAEAPTGRSDIRIEDVEYQNEGGRALLARVYRPAGAGPFPAVLQVHGGAWTSKDR